MDIVVGVSGGIAAYKSVQLVRLLVKAGHAVTVVPTEDALRFVGAPTWEAISRNPVTTSVHDDVAKVRHVALGQGADLVVVAPATANTIARMAAGIADNLLGTTLLATTAPVLIAPAMHAEMWAHPATQANIRTLVERGVHLIGPDDGELAGGDSGPGRMSEPEAIAEAALRLLAPQDLAGLTVVVSAGGTREPIDPVRYLGNRSSGRQGAALAVEAATRGADVELVAANLAGEVLAEAGHPRIRIRPVATAAELATAMKEAAARADAVVMAAAVADYRPAQAAAHKLTKEDGILERIELVENEDVLAALGSARRAGGAPVGQIILGFAAETATDPEARRERARRKRERKGADLLAVNLADAEHGFEKNDNAVEVIGPDGAVVAAASGSKRAVAAALWDAVVALRG
ncbi:MAG: bifunctional phosphopantothenoylcysteine decarboxylase/phosphopantothenate--cysteine ligase CoaBC [Microbacterium sp.]|jgi:phosphopantothenoylcysteine decarboxylase/phosphopantothenate--cysteine ligase|uniref:bifunctional phosphopantothenoylcysteine decarboxylase/phosphopantothenate--cysteine ligase CoaBC n=1 Tax=Microbacterium sp. TaxID=51671 RepID=UPI00282FF3A1|nr:bifunctional phosphopantothenoylcysteine decarboxylase/phosphopantothenate--cysteine ligase CoaBC [Microbacterium sp.]MDR2322522.1 bifunctional phosphopantothenoylcysteine decarboxylase/phosphopantothenate--cysteine ligase CoaBC [Microbacterium sp.]